MCLTVKEFFERPSPSSAAYLFQKNGDRLHLPDLLAVLPDRTIRRELAHPGHVENGHTGPPLLIPVGPAHLLLALHVGRVVCEDQIFVMIKKGIHKGFEQVRIAAREKSRSDQIDRLPEFRIGLIIRPWVDNPWPSSHTPLPRSDRRGRNSQRPLPRGSRCSRRPGSRW